MRTIQTNRDLYVAVADLIARNRNTMRPLEQYLRALWVVASPHHERCVLSPDEFFGVLSEAFIAPVPPFDKIWPKRYGEDNDDRQGFVGWEARLRRQVVDLHEMDKQKMLDSELRDFGLDSPRGQRWYNFDPCAFLECAAEGCYGGWRPGDDTGRKYVPGPVAIMGSDGKITSCDPREVPDPIVSIQAVSWDDFRSFLGYGQWFE